MTPEFSRPVRIDTLGFEPRAIEIDANEEERAALARRFGLVEIRSLAASLTLSRKGDEVAMKGRLRAGVTQSCVVTDAALDAKVDEPFDVLFRPQPASTGAEDEIELGESELDVVFYDGGAIDIGEAVAETLSLSLEPYPRAPDAEEVLRAAGVKSEEEAGAFGALAALRDKLKK
ncbi:MAG TPA: DUF177 domain-containing protein [Sphingomicrobium sp.]|nr:DUF177 domain-containing protein [Sphingomicrobium sp.]